ncbi:MAG TPA: hypothetical protein VJU53_08655 [Burkholderiaceae bacterium]|nr:hypothetical protein [Burkholderiaceae bacterium]
MVPERQPEKQDALAARRCKVLIALEEFWDNGQVRAHTVRDNGVGYVGVQQGFDEAGALIGKKFTTRVC